MADYIDDDNLWKEDLFGTLGVTQESTDAEIKKSYLKLAKKYHPDRFVEDNEEKQEAQKLFAKITVAYNTLIDPSKRNHYLELRRLLASHLPENQAPKAAPKAEQPQQSQQSQQSQQQSTQQQAPKQEPPKAEDPATTTEKLKEEQARSFYNIGMEFMKKNQPDKAIDSFKQAISIKSDISDFHTQLGIAYKNKNWASMAQAEFRIALKLNPKDAVARKNLSSEPPPAKKENKEGKGGLFGGIFGIFGKKK